MKSKICYLLLGLVALSFGNCSGRKQPDHTKPDVQLESGITGVTKTKVCLQLTADTPPGQVWCYNRGIPFQVGPQTAGLFCTINRKSTSAVDFTVGADLILFDDLNKISSTGAIPVLRYHEAINPNTKKPSIMAQLKCGGGFVPLGARKDDGSGHPHAGTGFAIGMVMAYPKDLSVKRPWREPNHIQYFELHQLSYDGKTFLLDRTERIDADFLPGGWEILNVGLPTGIADGDDLLYTVVCGRTKDDYAVSGVVRFKRKNNKWSPVAFIPVTDSNTWTEPSLIRDVDGSLLFTARSLDIAVWRSTDGGITWEQLFHREKVRVKAVPITINRAVDGTPYIATNKPGPGLYRDILDLWPLNEKRTELEDPIIARDAPAEFGPASGKTESYGWAVDHAVSEIVRLADGRWHNVLSYRIIGVAENRVGLAPSPYSGCYVEEVFSGGEDIISPWKF